MNYLDLDFPWYQNGIKTVKPSGRITMKQFINCTINPKVEMIKAFEEIQKAATEGNLKLKDELKTKHLFFTTPSVIVDPIRNYESIVEFRPFVVLEYDKIPHAAELRDYIFEKVESCIFAFLSPSKTGCKVICAIPQVFSVSEYKEYYFGLAHQFDKFINLDLSNSRCVLPLFNSYDPDAKFRESEIIPSTARGFKTSAFIPFEGEIEIPEKVSE